MVSADSSVAMNEEVTLARGAVDDFQMSIKCPTSGGQMQAILGA